MSYAVALPAYHGPLDLLLHLVRRAEVDVRDIPIARITDEFLNYLAVMSLLDVEAAGDFIVVAATLMEAKSESLLPDAKPEPDAPPKPEERDARRELVKQLIEYRKYRDAAAKLEGLTASRLARFGRVPPPEPPREGGPPPVRVVELWDLVSAFGRLMRETAAARPRQIVVDDTPQHVWEAHVRARLAAGAPVAFGELFDGSFPRAKLVGMFLAVLELIKRRQVSLEQDAPFAEIRLSLAA